MKLVFPFNDCKQAENGSSLQTFQWCGQTESCTVSQTSRKEQNWVSFFFFLCVVQLSYSISISEPSFTRFIHSYMSLTVFVLRIKKLEKERALIRQCKRTGWTDLCGELEQYEKVLEQGKDAESMRFHSTLQVSCVHDGQCFCVGGKMCFEEVGTARSSHHLGDVGFCFIFLQRFIFKISFWGSGAMGGNSRTNSEKWSRPPRVRYGIILTTVYTVSL